MPFVKLDCKILDSSLWPEKNQRDIFITALLMAQPHDILTPEKAINIRDLEYSGFIVPAGWYGFIPAAGVGIISRCGMSVEDGLIALDKLSSPDPDSRSKDFEGRRLVRIDGGFIALNYDVYRERDYSNAERCKRYRAKKKPKDDMPCHPTRHACRHVSDMQAEEEEEVEGDKKRTKKVIEDVIIPEKLLNHLEFNGVWEKWKTWRKRKKSCKDFNGLWTSQLELMVEWGAAAAIESMKASMANDWQGLFPPRNSNINKASKTFDVRKSLSELENP